MPLRRPGLPPDVHARLDLDRGERVLATARTATGSWVVATERALRLPAGDGFARIGWEQVDRASWSRDDGVLEVVEPAPLGGVPRRHRVPIDEPGRLVDLVREQVYAAVVASRHVALRGRRGFRVVARRRPGPVASEGADLVWSVAVDDGIDVSDPAVRARVAAQVAALKAELGQ